MNSPFAGAVHAAINIEPAREADVFDKTLYANAELLIVAGRFMNAARAIETSRAVQDFKALAAAYKETDRILVQGRALLDGIQHAIEAEQERRK